VKSQSTNNTAAKDQDASDRYLRLPAVLKIAGVSWRTLARWERECRFPKRYKIGPRIVAWKETEVHQWFAEQVVAAASTRSPL